MPSGPRAMADRRPIDRGFNEAFVSVASVKIRVTNIMMVGVTWRRLLIAALALERHFGSHGASGDLQTVTRRLRFCDESSFKRAFLRSNKNTA